MRGEAEAKRVGRQKWHYNIPRHYKALGKARKCLKFISFFYIYFEIFFQVIGMVSVANSAHKKKDVSCLKIWQKYYIAITLLRW